MLCNQFMNSGRVEEAIKLIDAYENTSDFKNLEDKDLYKWSLATGITYLRFGELKIVLQTTMHNPAYGPYQKWPNIKMNGARERLLKCIPEFSIIMQQI